jgi:thioredoxin 1
VGVVAHINESDFEREVLRSPLPVLIDVWAPWCGPCRVISPLVEKIARQFDGRVKVVKINADDNPELLRRFRIMGIPTLLFFRDGELADRMVGVQPEAVIINRLGRLVELRPEESAQGGAMLAARLRDPRVWIVLGFAAVLIISTILRAM